MAVIDSVTIVGYVLLMSTVGGCFVRRQGRSETFSLADRTRALAAVVTVGLLTATLAANGRSGTTAVPRSVGNGMSDYGPSPKTSALHYAKTPHRTP